MASWFLKISEARAYTATPLPASAPTLAAIATRRGVTLPAMVAKVFANATPFLQAEADIDGTRGMHSDAVDALTTVPQIITYDWLTGWPVIP